MSKSTMFNNKQSFDGFSTAPLGKCNILVIGKAGVGKSTLINNIFGDIQATTGVLRPTTKDIKNYNKEGFLFTIYDSPGLELPSDNAFERFFNDHNQKVKKQVYELIESNKKLAPKEHIHLIWYCIKDGTKFEQTEEKWIQELTAKNIPIIVVITQGTEERSEFLIELENLRLSVNKIISVLAEPKQLRNNSSIPAYGLDELVRRTDELLPEIAKQSFRNSLSNLNHKCIVALSFCAGYVSHSFGSGAILAPAINQWVNLPLTQTIMLVNLSMIFGLSIEGNLIRKVLCFLQQAGQGMCADMMFEAVGGNLSQLGATYGGNIDLSWLFDLFAEAGKTVESNLFIDNCKEIINQVIPDLTNQLAGGLLGVAGISAALSTLLLGITYTDALKETYMKALNDGNEPSLNTLEEILLRKYKENLVLIRSALVNLFGGNQSSWGTASA